MSLNPASHLAKGKKKVCSLLKKKKKKKIQVH